MRFVTLEEYKKDFARIISCKTLGTYNCVEKITIFLVNKLDNRTCNYYTIYIFGNSVNPTFAKETLTSKLITIDGDISLGIMRSIITIDEATEQFEVLC